MDKEDTFLGLTAEEEEALRDDEDIKQEQPDEQSTTEAGEEEPADEAASDEATADEEPAEEAVTERVLAEQSPFAPEFKAAKVENYEALIADADAKFQTSFDELASKYAAGEIDFTKHQSDVRALQAEYTRYVRELDAAKLKAEIADEYTKQAQAQKWELEQQMFFTDNPDFKSDPILRGALSGMLDVLYADEVNKGKAGLWFLREAGRMVNERFNPKKPDNVVELAPKAEAKLEAAKAAQAKKAVKAPPAPTTLADVPTAAPNDDGGEFSHLDGLAGEALEKAIAKMSNEARERWLAA